MADDLERRIRDKAHQLWEQEGRPEGRAADHWEKARILVAIEDDRTSLVPLAPEPVEEAKIQENLGEFPTASTDEGDRQQTPSRKAERAVTETAKNRLRSAFSSRRK
jgi:Protein of unknown function (DUF2934)